MNANGQITLYIQNLHAIKTWFFCFDTHNINAKDFIWLPCVHPVFQFWHHYRSSPFMTELLIRACLCLRPQLEFSLCLSFWAQVVSMFLPSVLICLSVCPCVSKCLISPLQSPSSVQFLNKGFFTRGWKEEDLASGATLQNLSIYQLCVWTSITSLNQCINIDNTIIYYLQNV